MSDPSVLCCIIFFLGVRMALKRQEKWGGMRFLQPQAYCQKQHQPTIVNTKIYVPGKKVQFSINILESIYLMSRISFFFFFEREQLLLLLSRFSHVQLCATPQTAAHQAPPSWDSPGKNTGVGCRFLLQCMKVKSESEATQSCLTLSDPMDCSLPGSSVHGISQGRVLEWGAIAFSGESNWIDF